MVVAMNDNYQPRPFKSIKSYQRWCIEQVDNGLHPDKLIGNEVYLLQEGELPTDDNYIDLHKFHCDLYKRQV